MRWLLPCLPAALAAAFVLGRAADPPTAVGALSTHVYNGRMYDVFRVPRAAVRCEIRSQSISCEHVPYSNAHYEVVFYKDNMVVYRLGNPHNPVWSARGRP